MKLRTQNRLKSFENFSIEANAMKIVKGGSSNEKSDKITIGGAGSRPIRPTGMSQFYIGTLFGG